MSTAGNSERRSAIHVSSEGQITNATADDPKLSTISGTSTDGTLGTNSDALLPTEKAIKTYVDGAGATGLDYMHATLNGGPGVTCAAGLTTILPWGASPTGNMGSDMDKDTGIFTFPATGIYAIIGSGQCSANNTGTHRSLKFYSPSLFFNYVGHTSSVVNDVMYLNTIAVQSFPSGTTLRLELNCAGGMTGNTTFANGCFCVVRLDSIV